MTIKVSDSTDIVVARCDLCTDIIYATTRDATSMALRECKEAGWWDSKSITKKGND